MHILIVEDAGIVQFLKQGLEEGYEWVQQPMVVVLKWFKIPFLDIILLDWMS
jgi:DNA-binding response OmpR family regulator